MQVWSQCVDLNHQTKTLVQCYSKVDTRPFPNISPALFWLCMTFLYYVFFTLAYTLFIRGITVTVWQIYGLVQCVITFDSYVVILHGRLRVLSHWIWNGVSATLQSGRYTLLYPRGRCVSKSIGSHYIYRNTAHSIAQGLQISESRDRIPNKSRRSKSGEISPITISCSNYSTGGGGERVSLDYIVSKAGLKLL